MEERNFNSKLKSSTKWSTIAEVFAKLVSPLTNMILARLLAPDAFGVIASVTMVISFADLFTDAGFQKYIVQHEFRDDEDLKQSTNVAFVTNFLLSLFTWTIIVLFRNQIATLVGNTGYGLAIAVSGLDIPLLSFSSIQMALFKRNFEFKKLFKIRIVTSSVPLVITVPFAFMLHSYWALIIGTLIRELVNAVLLTWYSSWKPQLAYSFEKLKEMFSFSMWTLLEQLSIWLTANIDIFIVGRVLNEHYLGIYKTSMTTVNAYMSIITASIIPVLFSGLSRVQNDETLFRETFYKFQRLVAVFVLPMGVGLYLYSDLVTKILLGSQWLEASGFIGLWSLTSALVIVFSHFNSEVYRSKGKPKWSLFTQCTQIVLILIAVLITYSHGFETLYTWRALARLGLIVVGAFVMGIVFKISITSCIKNVRVSLVATLIMGLVGLGLSNVSGTIVWQIVSILICILVYGTIILIFPKTRKEILGWIKKK